MYKEDLALNSLQVLICQPTNQPTNVSKRERERDREKERARERWREGSWSIFFSVRIPFLKVVFVLN